MGGPLSAFTLEWGRQTYTDPVRKNVYGGGGMLEVVHPPPESPARTPDGVVDCQGVVWLTNAPLGERLGNAQILADFQLALHKAFQDHFSVLTPAAGEDIALDCKLLSGEPPFFEVAMRPAELDQECIQELYERLLGVAAPTTQGGPVHFQMLFTLWGGSGQPIHPEAFPLGPVSDEG
jgi:hypothetical protein